MNQKSKIIVVTGPESTGKTTLTKDLAKHYNTSYIPEYAREYIENLQRPYEYADLEIIAKRQVQDLKDSVDKENGYLFLDTFLIITKVWFDIVYDECPDWIIDEIENCKVDLFLVCDTTLPWEPDNVRENGGEMREILFERYINELEAFNLPYEIVTGTGEDRIHSAIQHIQTLFS
ncbi:MAG TPA: ATP-binding protein [Bacteroidales bacterium]|nr:ATP-binding protein [Bacteroidales bacterium]